MHAGARGRGRARMRLELRALPIIVSRRHHGQCSVVDVLVGRAGHCVVDSTLHRSATVRDRAQYSLGGGAPHPLFQSSCKCTYACIAYARRRLLRAPALSSPRPREGRGLFLRVADGGAPSWGRGPHLHGSQGRGVRARERAPLIARSSGGRDKAGGPAGNCPQGCPKTGRSWPVPN